MDLSTIPAPAPHVPALRAPGSDSVEPPIRDQVHRGACVALASLRRTALAILMCLSVVSACEGEHFRNTATEEKAADNSIVATATKNGAAISDKDALDGPSRKTLLTDTIAAATVNAPAAHPETVPCPAPVPAAPAISVSPQLPADVCIPADFGRNPIDFFDDFSWRSFIAVVWPAREGQRGVPDPEARPGSPGRVTTFETYKADWELFQPNGAAPSRWAAYSGANPCNVRDLPFGALMLASFTKFGNVGQAEFGRLVGPLVAQNNTYVRYLAGFNSVEFDTIVGKKLYLRSKLEEQQQLGDILFGPDAQGNNPIDVKSSWIDMTNIAHPERYYTRKAWVFDPGTNRCDEIQVGLVGLHIVTKTASRPQWIWSSFEQIDNVPSADAKPPFTFNNGDNKKPMPRANPIPFPPPAQPPQIFNVTRTTPIHANTAKTSLKYREALAREGNGVWQFYTLVMTQWPIQPNAPPAAATPPENPGEPPFTFPGAGTARTAFANTTMETFDQNSIGKGCMACHNIVKNRADFIWALDLNAFPSSLGTSASQPQMNGAVVSPSTPELMELKQKLEQ